MIRRRSRFHSRAGFSMVHLVMIIAMFPVLIVATTTWVHESMKMSSRFKHRRETNVVLNHFASQFQDDVHRCKSLKFNSDSNQIELMGHEGQQIVFKIVDGGRIDKTFSVDGEVVGRESFRLSDEYFARWDDQAGTNRAALSVYRYPTPLHRSAPESLEVPDPKLELVITAKANRWKRTVEFGQRLDSGGEQ